MHDRITLRFLAAPSDAAADGSTVQAGSVLEWIDKAGYACAVGWSGSSCVTAYVGNVHFTAPISPGQLVEADARVIHTGSTSIHVRVSVSAADARGGIFSPATHCILVFVAIGDDGRPTPVPAWQPRSIVDLELAAGAAERIEARARIHAAMRDQRYTGDGTAPPTVFRFLAAPSAANFGGNAHGGTVMRWIDEAAATCAKAWSKEPAVAVYSGGIHFYQPIHIGDIVEVEARLIHTGPHSMHIAIHVRSGDPRTGELQLTTQCISVFVVKGANGLAARVPQLVLRSDEDIRLDKHARLLMRLRAELRALPLPEAL
ncbi:MAG: acyl-CoA thioesterase [Glaciihabitans sp.]|nr:acyl-CoA thioesterase [Glaciihabitans sp.]